MMKSVCNRNLYRGLVTAVITAGCVMAGCTPVDRWDILQPDWEKKLAQQAERPVGVPDEDQAKSDTPIAPVDFHGEGPIELSVEQATILALMRNRDLAVEQLNPIIVGTFEQIERGVFDPELFAEGAYSRETASETSRSTVDRFDVEGREVDAVAGIRQSLPTGTEIEGTVGQNRTISNRAPEQQEARFGMTVTQSLLRGFGPAVNLVGVRQAELDTIASRYELRGFTENLLAQTEIAYWNFILAGEQIAIFENSLEVATKQLDEIEQRIEVGVLAQTEAAFARVEVALREQALINARSNLEVRRLRLLRLINPTDSQTLDVQITPITQPRMEATAIADIEDRIRVSLQLRPDLNEARLRLEQGRLQTILTRNGLLPRLELFAALGKSGFADRFDDSYYDVDGPAYDLTVGARFSHLLGNRAAEARDLAARASRQQAAQAVSNLQQLIELDVRLAINEVERTRQQIAASALTRELQEQTLMAEQERFQVGAGTGLLVATAQRDLLESQIAEVESIIQYRIALVNLYLAEGSLLERRGITLGQTARGR